jgi:hypothetical protein
MSALCQKQTSRQIYSITSFARSRNGYGKRRIQTATLPWSSFSSYRSQRPELIAGAKFHDTSYEYVISLEATGAGNCRRWASMNLLA